MIRLLVILYLIVGISSLHAETIQSISVGSYFGECIGYCTNEFKAAAHNAKTIQSSYDKSLPTITTELKITDAEYREFVNSVDLTEFARLPEKIGCPDCWDQGGFWISIETDLRTKRIDYELGKEPKWTASVRALSEKIKKPNQSL